MHGRRSLMAAIGTNPSGGPRQLVKIAVATALLGYPVAIYFARDHFAPGQMLAGLLGLLALRTLVSTWIVRRHVGRQLALATLFAVAATVVGLRFSNIRMDWLRLYPMLLDLGVAAVFLGSLWSARPLVERIARVWNPNLPPSGVTYTRHVTQAWGVLMIVIALASLYTALAGSLRLWSLFNGVIVYVVIAVAFAGEYMLRRHMRRRWGTA